MVRPTFRFSQSFEYRIFCTSGNRRPSYQSSQGVSGQIYSSAFSLFSFHIHELGINRALSHWVIFSNFSLFKREFNMTEAEQATCSVYSMNNSSRNGLRKAFISALTSKIHFVRLFIQPQHKVIGDWEKASELNLDRSSTALISQLYRLKRQEKAYLK